MTPAAETSYADEHRDSLLVLLSRVRRHVQSTDEAELLATHVTHLLVQIDQAEAALARTRQLASNWAVLRTHGSAAYELRAALDTKEPTP
jgi:DNA-binding transcriptional LysR family regulator